MKNLFTILIFCVPAFGASAQEKYGNTLNMGLGIGGYSGYYGYLGRTLPVFHIDYEIDVAKNFTVAPFASFYSYSNRHFYGGPGNSSRYYTYRETVIPVGAKGTYYFDDLLNVTSKWDFYLAGSLGFAIISSKWDSDYPGDRNYYRGANPVFLDLHLGGEYHFNETIGAYLDLSTGVSTIGIAFHLNK